MKRIVTLTLLLTLVLWAQSRLLSPIPLPRNTIIDLDTAPYSEEDLLALYDDGEFFTFLAKTAHTTDPELLALRQRLQSLFRLAPTPIPQIGEKFRVAVIVPNGSVGRYVLPSVRSALGYLLQRGRPFEMTVFPIATDENSSLAEILDQTGGYDFTIAYLTTQSAQALCDLDPEQEIYLPTLHRSRLQCTSQRIHFGGIDYWAQVATLVPLAKEKSAIYTVSDTSGLSRMLTRIESEYLPHAIELQLPAHGSYYKGLITRHRDLNQSTLFLNTPVVKSSLFLSQMTLADYKPRRVLSTQLNYSPMLLTLTQYHDRETMTLASSIGKADPVLTEYLTFLGEDIRFHWLNYATVVGLDRRFSAATGLSPQTDEPFVGGDAAYRIHLYDAGLYRFIPRAIEVPAAQEEPLEERPPSLPTPASYPDNGPEPAYPHSPYDDEGVFPSSHDPISE